MSGFTAAFVRAFLLAVCGGDTFFTSRVEMPHVLSRIADSVARLPALHRWVFRVTVFLMELGVPPLAWKLRPFTRLSPESQARYLESWRGSRLQWKRNVFRLVKSVCLCSLLAEDAILEEVGYGPALRHRREPAQGERCPTP